jgi:UDP-N-acetylmuramyl pentapeptide phosphotransferase/UDP-N-acetylglucosamine-1-phosphate transferase
MSGDSQTALIAFALAGGVLAFLYFNLNPARIFMGDTGSLVLGFVIAVLTLRLVQVNNTNAVPVLINTPVIALSIVLIPVYDTMRVFAVRIWNGKSPFHADRTHIHHLLTNQRYSHAFASKIIYIIHGIILIEAWILKSMKAEFLLLTLICSMLLFTFLISRMGKWLGKNEKIHDAIKEYLG